MIVYWAGPLFSQAHMEFNQRATTRLENEGFDVYLPQRDTTQEQNAPKIFLEDRNGILISNVVVGVCDGADMDSGTAWEMGFAYGKKLIIALRTDFRSLEGYEKNIRGRFNLMISQSADYVVGSIEEVIQTLHNLSL